MEQNDECSDHEIVTWADILEKFLRENQLPFRISSPNSANGDCWYESLVMQVFLHNIEGVPKTARKMRQFIITELHKLPEKKLWVKNNK